MTANGIKHGPLSAEEIAKIEHMVGTMKKPSAKKIADALNRPRSTVNWRLLMTGLVDRKITYARTEPYKRGKVMIYPFTREQDARLIELRNEQKNPHQIAEIMTREFGAPRYYHSIDVRLRMLAAYEDGPEAHIA